MGLEVPVKLICPVCGHRYVQEKATTCAKLKLVQHMFLFHDTSQLHPTRIQTCTKGPTPVDFTTTECAECGKKFQDGKILRLHLERQHNQDPSQFPFACRMENCTEKFPTEEGLEMHVAYSRSNKRAKQKCPKCQGFYASRTLKRHILRCGNDQKRSFICETCGKEFGLKVRLDTHSLSHSGPESWKFCCETCDK